jgi:hypothetical protein
MILLFLTIKTAENYFKLILQISDVDLEDYYVIYSCNKSLLAKNIQKILVSEWKLEINLLITLEKK